MEFIRLLNSGHGSSHAPIVMDNVKHNIYGELKFENLHSFECKKSEDSGKTKLDTKWTHYVVLNGGEVYRFWSYMGCELEAQDIPATEEQCRDIINKSHEDLLKEWDKHRNEEVNFFPSILPLTNEQKPLFVDHLMKKLNEE